MSPHEHQEAEFSFKSLFVPLTTLKAIHFIVIVGIIVFFNMLFNDFVWDDTSYIIGNSQIHNINLMIAFGRNVFNIAGQYRPIAATYFSILYSLFGNLSFFYHFLQIILHIFCSILLYILFRRFLSSGIALFSALIFLIHPINVESVSYIAQTGNQLLLIFGLVPLLFLTRKNISIKLLITNFFLLLLSLLTKETGIIFLFLIILNNILIQKNNLFKLITGTLITVCIYAYFRFVIGQVDLIIRPLTPIAELPLLERILNIPAIIFYYLKTFLFPRTLIINQQWIIPSVNFSSFYFPLIIDIIFFFLIGAFGIYIFKYKKNKFKPYFFFTAWFLVGLFFHSQIFPLDITVADRWFYIPLVGLLGILGIFYQSLSQQLSKYRKTSFLLAVVIIIFLSLRTIIRNANWQNAITLYNHDILINDDFTIENDLGLEYANRGEYNKALKYFQRSVALKPFEINLENLGSAYESLENLQKARIYFNQALHAKNYNASYPHKHEINTYTSNASMLVYFDDPSTAKRFIQDALQDYPESSDLWMFLSIVKSKLHDKQGALEAANKGYQLYPDQLNLYIYNQIFNDRPFSIPFHGNTFTFNN